MDNDTNSPLSRALRQVDLFSDQHYAVLPETPGAEMLRYVAGVTHEDIDKLKRIYELFITVGRMDRLGMGGLTGGSAGFAEE